MLKKKKALSAEEQRYAFEEMPVPRALAKFMIPMVLSELTSLLLNIADAFFIGRTGDTYQVAAMTITFPLIMMIAFLAVIFATGGNTNVAKCLGLNDRKTASKYTTFCIYTSLAVCALYAIFIAIFQNPILRLLGASEHSIGFCRDYMFWALIAAFPPVTFNHVIAQLFLAEGESRISGFGISLSAILNLIFDPILIFVFDMGIAGAGLATCVAHYIGSFYYLYQWHRLRKTSVISFRLRNYQLSDGICRNTISIGLPAGLVLLLTNICDFFRNYYLGSLGSDTDLAAWGAVQKVGNSLMFIAMGIAQGLRPLASYNFAAGNLKRTRVLIRGSILTMAVYIAFALLLTHIAPEATVRLFVTDPDAVSTASYFLRVWTFCYIGLSFSDLFNSIFQSFGKWKLSLANTFINKGLLLTPVLILMVHFFGINGIPYSQVITESITGLVLFFVYLGMMRSLMKKGESAAK